MDKKEYCESQRVLMGLKEYLRVNEFQWAFSIKSLNTWIRKISFYFGCQYIDFPLLLNCLDLISCYELIELPSPYFDGFHELDSCYKLSYHPSFCCDDSFNLL